MGNRGDATQQHKILNAIALHVPNPIRVGKSLVLMHLGGGATRTVMARVYPREDTVRVHATRVEKARNGPWKWREAGMKVRFCGASCPDGRLEPGVTAQWKES